MRIFIKIWFLWLLSIVWHITAFVFDTKDCRNDLPIMNTLNLNEITGFWYKHSRFADQKLFHPACATTNITLNSQTNTLNFDESFYSTNENHIKIKLNGIAKFLNKNEFDGKFILSYGENEPDIFYQIIEGDFKNYMIIYYCAFLDRNNKNFTVQESLIFTRDRIVDENLEKYFDTIEEKYFSGIKILKILQTDEQCEEMRYLNKE